MLYPLTQPVSRPYRCSFSNGSGGWPLAHLYGISGPFTSISSSRAISSTFALVHSLSALRGVFKKQVWLHHSVVKTLPLNPSDVRERTSHSPAWVMSPDSLYQLLTTPQTHLSFPL